ncbi:MAG: hypothetical protein JJU36_09885 [Phycisphaeraceae bacterium]|nr:hypothetical protein [Phycisphaeraceae bacterium]
MPTMILLLSDNNTPVPSKEVAWHVKVCQREINVPEAYKWPEHATWLASTRADWPANPVNWGLVLYTRRNGGPLVLASGTIDEVVRRRADPRRFEKLTKKIEALNGCVYAGGNWPHNMQSLVCVRGLTQCNNALALANGIDVNNFPNGHQGIFFVLENVDLPEL